jgi:sulfotransferase family protein
LLKNSENLHKQLTCVLFWFARIVKLVERFVLYGRSVSSMTHTETPVTLLKITGLGRSGSTILDIVLGNHPQIESVGEVGNLVRNGWISQESLRGIDQKKRRVPLCTCGKRLDVLYVDTPEEACPFWSSVRREWVERTDRDSIESYPKLQDTFELKRRWSRYGLDSLLRLLYEKRRPSAPFRSYARLTLAFFESIRAVSKKPIIVDSSKSPVRTFALSMVPGIDLYVVHLVRDGRGVITSLRKSFEKDLQAGIMWDHKGNPIWKTILRWIIQNLAAEWVCTQLGPKRTMRLRYEDFVADPKTALERIGSLMEHDLSGLADAASSGKPMQAGHNIGGNRTKKSGTITLRPDDKEWKTALSHTEQRLSWVLIGWLMRRYGYAR